MAKFFALLISICLCLLTPPSFAQKTTVANDSANIEVTEKAQQVKETSVIEPSPEVGKHVLANMDASSMILSLLMVLALIIISALVLKRFNLTQQNSNQLKVIANLSLGAKERIVVVQIGEQQLVLGVCPQQISLLKDLETPLDIQVGKPMALPGNVLSFLQKNSIKASTDGNVATSETNNK
jgi:flagellar protein FliO/FliZ